MQTEPVITGGGTTPDRIVNEGHVRRLARACRESAYGFAMAAEEVRTPACQSLFLTLSRQREEFAKELERDEKSALRFRLHRRWVDFLAKVSRRSLAHVLAELLREEKAAMQAYETALATPLDASLRPLAVRHHAAIRRAYETIRGLFDLGVRAR